MIYTYHRKFAVTTLGYQKLHDASMSEMNGMYEETATASQLCHARGKTVQKLPDFMLLMLVVCITQSESDNAY